MSSSAKCNYLYFMIAGITRYLVNVFICLFLDHNQCSHYYWRRDSYKVPHFFNFYFQIFWIYLYSLTNMLSVSTDIPIRKHALAKSQSSFSFCYWFKLVFIPFFTIQYSKVFAYFSMNVMSYFIMHFNIFYWC